MQKVEGSNPFIRSIEKPRVCGVFVCPGRLTGHTDAGFTLRDGRDDAGVAEDVLARAATARIGT